MPTTLPGTGVPVTTAPVTTVNGAAAAASEVVQRVVVGTLAGTAFTDLGPVTRGAGVSDANTQRVTLASDGPAVTALSSLDTKTPAVGQALMVASRPVVIASNQSAIPVSLTSTTIAGSVATTGTFFQATQPVSLTSTTITGSVATTGTFFQATQPVSIATTVNVAGTRNNNGSANVTGSFHLTVGGSDGTNLRPLSVDTTGRTNVNSILAAETTKIIGTVNVSAAQTIAAVTAITNALPAGANVIGALTANQSVNKAQINGVAPLMGNGVSGTGTQRVNIASDNTAFPVNATLSAETTKVIGTVNVSAGQAIGVTGYPTAAASADALANPTVTKLDALASLYNGTSWDRARGMSGNLTTGDTGAKIVTGVGATVANVGNKGVQILLSMGAVTGTTPTFVLKLQGSVDGGTSWYDIPGATTATLVATGLFGITVYPGVVATAATTTTGTTSSVSMVMPRTWRAAWTISGTTPSFTITGVQYNYLNN